MVRIMVCALVHPQRCKRLQYSRRRLAHLLALSAVGYEYTSRQEAGDATEISSVRVQDIAASLLEASRICSDMTAMVGL